MCLLFLLFGQNCRKRKINKGKDLREYDKIYSLKYL